MFIDEEIKNADTMNEIRVSQFEIILSHGEHRVNRELNGIKTKFALCSLCDIFYTDTLLKSEIP